jgi:hypothetical protein
MLLFIHYEGVNDICFAVDTKKLKLKSIQDLKQVCVLID